MKKLNTVLLAISLVLSAFSFTAFTEVPPGWFYCDVNGDELTDNLDAAYILKYDAGIIDEIENGDANGDGTVDNLDAAMVLKYDAGLDPNGPEYCSFEAMCAAYVPDKYRDDHGGVIPGIPAMVIRSTEELRDYLGDVTELSNGGASPFMPYEKYNGEFFENNILILEIAGSSASSDTYKVDSVKYGNEGLDIVIEFISPELCTCDIVYRTIFIALDKAYDVPAEKVKVDYVYSRSYGLFYDDPTYGVKPRFTPASAAAEQSLPVVTVIQSVEEYNAYISAGSYDFDATLPGIDSYNSVYEGYFNESYFTQKVLVAIVTPSLPTTTRYRVEGSYNKKKDVPSIDITVESFKVSYGDEKIIGSWHIMLEVEKYVVGEDDIKELLHVEFVHGNDLYIAPDIKTSCILTGSEDAYETPVVIESVEELTAYCNESETLASLAPTAVFWDTVKEYDGDYFENKCLVVIPRCSVRAIGYNVKSVEMLAEGNSAVSVVTELIIQVESISTSRNDGFRSWHILIEMDKEYAVSDEMVRVSTIYVH